MISLFSRWILSCSILSLFSLTAGNLSAQTLQWQYDLRHTVDPDHNPKDFSTLYFEYFRAQDSGTHFIKPGSFLIKTQADLSGAAGNIGKCFVQVSQSLRCWRPRIFLSFQYSGGLGVTEPRQYSYYINNSFAVGVEVPFRWKGAWFSSILYYRYVPYTHASQDLLYTLYWFAGLRHFKWEIGGDLSVWSENKDHGDDPTRGLTGKRLFFFAEPQLWFNFTSPFALGARINIYYHLNTNADLWQFYPALAIRCKL